LISHYCKMFSTNSNIVLMVAGHQMEHIMNSHREWEKRFELLFTMTWISFLYGHYFRTNKFMSSLTSFVITLFIYEGVPKSFQTGRLEQEMQMVQLPATRCTCIAILWVSLVSFAAITLCVVSQLVFIVVVYFVIDLVWKLLHTPSYIRICIYIYMYIHIYCNL
jgi:hypothetical protein